MAKWGWPIAFVIVDANYKKIYWRILHSIALHSITQDSLGINSKQMTTEKGEENVKNSAMKNSIRIENKAGNKQ